MTKRPNFIEYTKELHARFVAEGKMAEGGKEEVSFNEILLHATPEERDRLKELLVADSARLGEDADAVGKEWDALVEAVVKGDIKKSLADTEAPVVDTSNFQTFYLPSARIDARYMGIRKSKHQCVRKPRPKQRGVKHGNRKKKK